MGRGIEGTGNTKYAIELSNYINSRDEDSCEVIANKDKKWGREKSHENSINLVSYSKDTDSIKSKCVAADAVIVLSVPAKNFDKESKDSFIEILEACTAAGVTTTYIQVDHKIHSINRNFYAEKDYECFFTYIDKTITHSLHGDFTRFCDKRNIEIKNLVTSSDKLNGINGLDYNKYKKYWKSFEEKEYRTIKFLGRVAAWKGPWLFREMHEKYFKGLGYIATLEGIEMSIQSLQFLYKSWDPVKIVRDDNVLWTAKEYETKLDNGELTFERNHVAYMLPPYNNVKALERMSKQQFGIELLLLDDRFLCDIMEYAMMEIVAVGTIPIFRKRWAELFKINGKPIIEYGEETGTVFFDEENPDEYVELINRLSDDKDLYDKYRHNAFNFYSKYLDNSVVFNKLIDIIVA